MAVFPMCAACRLEYDDVNDRRFHAQPNACSDCGPSVRLVQGTDLAEENFPRFDRCDSNLRVMRKVRERLAEGKIVAIKGLGGFLLACDAQNDSAVHLLRERKGRSDKPFALMAPDVAAVEKLCIVSDPEHQILSSHARPIVILPRRADSRVSVSVAPCNNTGCDASVYASPLSLVRGAWRATQVRGTGHDER